MFAEWWNSLGLASQILYCIAIPSTLVLLIQTILMFLGFDDGPDADVEVDISEPDVGEGVFGDNSIEGWEPSSDLGSLHIFTFRGIIAFFVIFGWVGIVMQSYNVNLPITIIVATVCGFAMMIGIAFLLRLVMRLKNSGTADNRNAIGAAGKVYLTIPPSRSGEGKINIMLQGAYVERNAVTDETESIPTGCEIIVVGTSGETSLVVKRK
jgi:membrane protein implicated in regulation of membrane protease activity